MHQTGPQDPQGSSCGTLAPGSATHGASPQSAPTVMERGAFRRGLVLALDIQNPPVIPGELEVFGTPLKPNLRRCLGVQIPPQ